MEREFQFRKSAPESIGFCTVPAGFSAGSLQRVGGARRMACTG